MGCNFDRFCFLVGKRNKIFEVVFRQFCPISVLIGFHLLEFDSIDTTRGKIFSLLICLRVILNSVIPNFAPSCTPSLYEERYRDADLDLIAKNIPTLTPALLPSTMGITLQVNNPDLIEFSGCSFTKAIERELVNKRGVANECDDPVFVNSI